jgi:hypothetical protein
MSLTSALNVAPNIPPPCVPPGLPPGMLHLPCAPDKKAPIYAMPFVNIRRSGMFPREVLAAVAQHPADLISMATRLAAALLARQPTRPCVVEIEATFGEKTHTHGTFKQQLDPELTQYVLTALEHGESDWESKTDWIMYTDSYFHIGNSQDIARSRMVGGQTSPPLVKTVVCRQDLRCADIGWKTSTGDAWDKCEPPWIRLNVKTEEVLSEQVVHDMGLVVPASVRLSLRKNFVRKSQTLPGVTWTYTVGRAWTAPSAREAEAMMHARDNIIDSSVFLVEIETEVNWEDPESVNPTRVLMICLSLLLKVQDLSAIITGSRSVWSAVSNIYKSQEAQSYPMVAPTEKQLKLRVQSRQRKRKHL